MKFRNSSGDMKTIFPLIILSFSLLNVSAQGWVERYDALLNKYAKSDGVKYKKLKAKDYQTLSEITTAIASEKPSGTDADKLAYYLNAYNAWMLKKAVDVYPTPSVFNNDKDVYKRKDIKVGGETMSLDYLENSVIRKKFTEPRIHFALNCASEGCPPLHKSAFKGSTLNEDLHQLTTQFMSSKNGVKEGKDGLQVNQIFEWFAVDFKKDSGSVLNYIKKYRGIKGEPTISYLPYSWNLNED